MKKTEEKEEEADRQRLEDGGAGTAGIELLTLTTQHGDV